MQDSDWNDAPREPFGDHPGERLLFTLDDEEDPKQVTVYPEWSPDVTTTWVTIDVAHAVDLREMA